MDDNQERQFNLPAPRSNPRKFVYRSAEREDYVGTHPLRRANDTPHAFRSYAGELCPNTTLLKFRVYMKVN
jgi:hypothetical protein